jgi:hypothetical protein
MTWRWCWWGWWRKRIDEARSEQRGATDCGATAGKLAYLEGSSVSAGTKRSSMLQSLQIVDGHTVSDRVPEVCLKPLSICC